MQVLSNGDSANAARSASTGQSSTVYHNTPQYGSTLFTDADLAATGQILATASGKPIPAGYYDVIALSFEITPTLSGPLVFRCVPTLTVTSR